MIGTIIKMERIRQKISQPLLCHGICAVSYLSKIENETIVCSYDIYNKLFQKLGISYISNDNLLQRFNSAYKNVLFILRTTGFCHTEPMTALVGASGSGKTTTAKLLQRFWNVNNRKITINNVDIRNIRLEALRELVTIVPQEIYLFNMSIADNLRLAYADADDGKIKSSAMKAQADGFTSNFSLGYETKVKERGLRQFGFREQETD